MNNTLYKTKNPISKFIIILPKSCTDDPESYPSKFAEDQEVEIIEDKFDRLFLTNCTGIDERSFDSDIGQFDDEDNDD